MKINHPVNNEEVHLDEDTVIVSKTDLKGSITYVNDEFTRISGYSEAELLGKNHNIVRHPDVPPAAFKDLWETIEAGRPWTGFVKNRAKSGAFYWVHANVTPVFKDGRIVEYMSVRRCMSKQQKQAASELYAAINKGVLPEPSRNKQVGLLGGLKLTSKIMLATIASLLVIVALLGLQISSSLNRIDLAETEVAGLEYIQPLRELLQNLPKHRGMSNGYLNGDEGFRPKILAKQEEIEQIISRIQVLEQRHGELLQTGSRLTALINEWTSIRQDLFKLEPKTAFSRHTALIANLLELISHVSDSSGLIVDSSQSRHYLVDMLINKISPVSEYLGQTRGMGAGIAARGDFAPGQRDRLTDLFSSARVLFNSMDSAVESLYRHDSRLKSHLQQLVQESDQHRAVFFDAVRSGLLDAERIQLDPKEFFAKGSRLIDANFAIFDQVNALLRAELGEAAEQARLAMYETLAGSLVVMLLMGGVAFTIMRNITAGLTEIKGHFGRIAEGYYYDDIELGRGDELGDLLRDLKSMQIKLAYDVNEARERAASITRIKSALDNVSSSVMMADNDANIIYLNKTAERLFRDAEEDIRHDLPDFDAGVLLGASIDQFHKNPQHQRRMLMELDKTFGSELKIGGRTFKIVANPVVDGLGERLGLAVEWRDRTLEVAVEEEVESLIGAARNGDLTRRISLGDKQGFFLNLGTGINELVETLSAVFDEIASVMGRLSHGDLSHTIERDFNGLFALVKEDVNDSMANLKEMIRKLRDSTSEITHSSDEIFAGNNNLSARTEQQASALQETATSMEQLSGTVRNNADNAQQANRLAAQARNWAEKGGEVVNQAIRAMEAINASSNKIAEIIGVIDEIAFQTNLLALNASVEAARAGEQGRGFAVVATEVRNLAGRSATAAKEIKELIKDSAIKVEAGSELVNQSGETLVEIVNGVKKVGDIVSDIAAASQEQSAGIDQVKQAVTSMDETTQQNAALAEQTSAASLSMKEKASEMDSMMDYFKLEPTTARLDCGDVGLDFFKARSAHLAWRVRIRDFLDGNKNMNASEALSHRDCSLGQWLYHTGLDCFGHSAEMRELESAHEHLHKIIKEIVSLKNAGETDRAEAMYGDVEFLSGQVAGLIKNLERQVA